MCEMWTNVKKLSNFLVTLIEVTKRVANRQLTLFFFHLNKVSFSHLLANRMILSLQVCISMHGKVYFQAPSIVACMLFGACSVQMKRDFEFQK